MLKIERKEQSHVCKVNPPRGDKHHNKFLLILSDLPGEKKLSCISLWHCQSQRKQHHDFKAPASRDYPSVWWVLEITASLRWRNPEKKNTKQSITPHRQWYLSRLAIQGSVLVASSFRQIRALKEFGLGHVVGEETSGRGASKSSFIHSTCYRFAPVRLTSFRD